LTVRWRSLNNAVHRDVGYLCVALTVLYAISGVAVNHKEDWNPSRRLVRETRRFEPVPVGEREAMVATLVARLSLPGPPRSSFRSAPHLVELYYDGWSVSADALAGVALVERLVDRPLLRDANFLHLNEPKRLWTWVADLYAVLLLVLAATGMLVLRGRNGLMARGKWLVGAGLLIPVAFLVALRYL
jgi:hypothetical protein